MSRCYLLYFQYCHIDQEVTKKASFINTLLFRRLLNTTSHHKDSKPPVCISARVLVLKMATGQLPYCSLGAIQLVFGDELSHGAHHAA